MIYTYFVNTSDIEWCKIQKYLYLLEPSNRYDIVNYRRMKDRILSLTGKLLILYFIRTKYNFNVKKLPLIKYNEFGKPYLDKFEFIKFSISHSEDIVGCSLTINGSIGLDIEKSKPIDWNEFKEVFCNMELNSFQSEKDKLRLFYSLWTQKESLLKAIGYGLTYHPKDINILSNPLFFENVQYYKIVGDIYDDYHYSIHINRPIKDITLQIYNINRILNEL